MGNKNEIVKKQVILNLIQDLQRMLLQLVNNVRGRCQIKFGMTSLCNNRGFTLIELLVVVLIIGILAAIAVPQYQKAVEKSRYAAMLTLLQTLTKAQQQYYLVHGTYATTFAQLDEVGPALPAQQLSSGYTCPNWATSIHRPLGPTECASIVSDIGNGALRVTIPFQGSYNATKAKKAAQTGYYYVFEKFSTLPQAGLYCVRYDSEPAGPCRGTRVMNNGYGQWFTM